MKLPVSAFIICQDEERVIERCIRSLSFCAEIVVVDSGSTDSTLKIIDRLVDEGLPIAVFHNPWQGYGAQKQFALSKCGQRWCLSIDSDERVSPELARNLPNMLLQHEVTGWAITRFNYLNGYGYVPPSAHEGYYNRLFQNGKGRFFADDLVHERIEVTGVIRRARSGGLLHFSPLSLHQQIAKENKYSTLKAAMKRERGQLAQPWKMLVSPPLYFLKAYFGHGLWRCGWPGVIKAGNGAIYSFLTEAKRFEHEAKLALRPEEPSDIDRY